MLEYFTLYRKAWRNASTHDHRIDFDEQEAFLAYSTVCGFCFVAVNQIIQVLASQKASVALAENANVNFDAEQVAKLLSAELPALIKSFSVTILGNDMRLSESALIGGIEGLIKSSFKNINTVIEPHLISLDRQLRPDLVVSQLDEQLVVEVKGSPRLDYKHLTEQIATYIEAVRAIGGVGVVFPRVFSACRDITFEIEAVNCGKAPIYIVNFKQNGR